MYKCQDCNFSTNWSCSLKRHEKGVHNEGELNKIYNNTLLYKCQDCTFSSNWLSNLKRHEQRMHQNYIMNTVYSNNSRSHENGIHNQGELNQNYNNTLYAMNQDVYDIRLKENFKIFISGPSRCGKTVFVSNLLERINEFAKVPPTNVIYVYKVWQSKYDEMLSLGVNF